MPQGLLAWAGGRHFRPPGLRWGERQIRKRRDGANTEILIMTDEAKEVEALKREVAELSGLVLATGVLFTQLLQSNLKRELNPWQAATKMLTDARTAIEGFNPETMGERDPAMKQRALDALTQYEQQLRSVLPV